MSHPQHWVSCWGNATSITDRRECVYARDITLRYPIRICFTGDKFRFRLSNLTGTEPVTISSVLVALRDEDSYDALPVLFDGQESVVIPAGEEVTSDETSLSVKAGNVLDFTMYLGDYTQMNAGTLVTGPLSKGQYAYGDYAKERNFPADKSRSTNWFYFLNTIDILTDANNHALVCYGDSITAQSWPDYLAIRAWEEGYHNVAIIRRAVCGTRILRQYDCITYQAYGLKGATRFPVELNVSGASAVIIQHGINDIIHPVGTDVNPFRPWSDMPTVDELTSGFQSLYVSHARSMGIGVWGGTLLPILGWRTYTDERERIRVAFNQWLRGTDVLDGVVDFDQSVCDPSVAAGEPGAFAPGFDSGDHLHPSEEAYRAMAQSVPSCLLVGRTK